MKYFYLLLTLSLIFPGLSHAQDLAENNKPANSPLAREASVTGSGANSAPGAVAALNAGSVNPQWEKEQDHVNGHIGSSKLSGMRIVTESIITFFHDSCLPDHHYNPVWHGEYSSEKISAAPQIKFSAVANFYEQKARLAILANDISPLLDHLMVNNQSFFTIQSAATAKNGATCFETPGSKTWLVTTDDRQLYTPVTRKEYLREARMELNNNKKVILANMQQKMPVRTAAVQEAEKKAAIEQLNAQYAGTELQVRMKMFLSNYKTDEEYFKANADKATADLDSTIHLMDYIAGHLSAADLDRPAILSGQAAEFQGFEASPSDKMLIRINPAWFNPYLSPERPQFFLVCWQYDPTEPAAADIDRQIRERLDCQKLKEMLGK